MKFVEKARELAKKNVKRIALPEGSEERTLKAVAIIVKEKVADVTLIGNEAEIRANAAKVGTDLSGVKIIEPAKSPKFKEYANAFYELRKAKGVTPEKAEATVSDPVYFGTMMVKAGDVDGMVSGAIHSTGDLLRPGLQVIKTAPGIKSVSSFFVMEVPNCKYGDNGMFLFADCAVTPLPTAEDLANIAVATAKNAKNLCGMDPKVAMLSFSTKGSAKHDNVTKVVEATKLAHEMDPNLALDGEWQLDAALVETVANLKAPGSKVAGHANVLIFPDLQAANIGYKLVQRLAGADATGPICQGFARPINDLSRGCNVEDIVNVVAITAVQAQNI